MFRNHQAWMALQARAMNEDFSWNLSVPSYLAVYRQALGRKAKGKKTNVIPRGRDRDSSSNSK